MEISDTNVPSLLTELQITIYPGGEDLWFQKLEFIHLRNKCCSQYLTAALPNLTDSSVKEEVTCTPAGVWNVSCRQTGCWTAHLFVPALHPQFLPLLPLGEVVGVHVLLWGVPVVQQPLRDLQEQSRAQDFHRVTLRLSASSHHDFRETKVHASVPS